MAEYIWLIPFFPLLGFLYNGLITFFSGEKLPAFLKQSVRFISPSLVLASFIVAVFLFIDLLSMSHGGGEHGAAVLQNELYTWIQSGNLVAPLTFQVDNLSIVMTLIITGVGFLIHLYSTGYMADDPSYSRYFAWLNLFTFAMLLLVLGNNILLMFIGWEGVGLASYLLIGFWFGEKANAKAGMKAFIVNRVGDFGFLIGFFLLFWAVYQYNGTVSIRFSELKTLAASLPPELVTWIVIFLFVGATGKSAQIPLYVWLPDAMAGPTPVSALIHAATMVTAGVYMIARFSFLFSMSAMGLTVVSIIAGLTAFFAATVGMTQNDIKKVLAYSTVSQLGYMFLAMGAGAYSAGVFHLMTHAFFKGLLFLGSGSVILAMHHEQDMRQMGGLKTRIPITYLTFLAGTLAIAGFPGFAGFFSKDEILWKVYSTPNEILPWLPFALWFLAAITAGITSFYMFRLFFMTFHGEYRGSKETWAHMHESPYSMTIPLMLLSLLSVFGGLFGVPEILGGSNHLHHWLAPVLTFVEEKHPVHFSHILELTLMFTSVLISFTGIGIAFLFYVVKPEIPKQIVEKISGLHALVYQKYLVDELYAKIIIRPLLALQQMLRWFDMNIVDGIVNGVGTVTRWFSRINGWIDRTIVDGLVGLLGRLVLSVGNGLRSLQRGYLSGYLYFIVGAVIVIFLVSSFAF